MDTTKNDTKTVRKVLCVEDEFFISELYSRALTRGGYQVEVVTDGLKGLAMAMTNDYDIILLDIMVPNMTGIDILRHLREEKADLRAKIIITTNLDQGKENRTDIEKHADGYIIKAEITPRQLVEFLDNIK
ncbi:MAG: response regulator [Candidatus Saccharibacteria bacterium]|nr:response regulator [Candidatus Saccharibacteria bacterium]